jgi:SAM-dependent methyltransferase
MEQPSRYCDGSYLEHNPTYHVEDAAWKAGQVLKMLRKHRLQPWTIGEIGCGAGEVLRQLQLQLPEGPHFYGYDISPDAIALCRQRENDRLHFACADLLTTETKPFDLLLCLDVVEHVEDYLGFLRRLRPKATHHLFHIPLEMSAQNVFRCRPIFVGRATAGHLHYFMKDTALLTLQDAGYTIVDWFYTPCGDQGKGLRSLLARWPRRVAGWINPDLAARVLGGYSLLVLAK